MKCEIQAQGQLPITWQDWFPGLTLQNNPDGTVLLSGSLPDQSALLGVLYRLSTLGLSLISCQTSPEQKPSKFTSGG